MEKESNESFVNVDHVLKEHNCELKPFNMYQVQSKKGHSDAVIKLVGRTECPDFDIEKIKSFKHKDYDCQIDSYTISEKIVRTLNFFPMVGINVITGGKLVKTLLLNFVVGLNDGSEIVSGETTDIEVKGFFSVKLIDNIEKQTYEVIDLPKFVGNDTVIMKLVDILIHLI